MGHWPQARIAPRTGSMNLFDSPAGHKVAAKCKQMFPAIVRCAGQFARDRQPGETGPARHARRAYTSSLFRSTRARVQMDDIVIRAMTKWPDVPAVFGWLSLDRRGAWAIKSAAPPGAEGTARSFKRITNPKVSEFIARNYLRDAEGRWYFQNGPQRVYVALAYTPLIYRTAGTHPPGFESHCGVRSAALERVWMDESGDLLLMTSLGPGLLLDRDLPKVMESLCYADGHALDEERLLALLDDADDAEGVYFHSGAASLPLERLRSAEAPRILGYVREPRPAAGQPDC
jgi:hypothetical protein